MKPLPAHEQLSVSTDLPLIWAWTKSNPSARAEVRIDRDAFDSNMGHVLLVVGVRELSELDRAREELTALVVYPDRLRVRRWKPTEAEVLRVRDWLRNLPRRGDPGATHWTALGVDHRTGLLHVWLNRRDPAYATYLEQISHGLIEVDPNPEGPAISLASAEPASLTSRPTPVP